jgi:excisionase family DNA binding protein
MRENATVPKSLLTTREVAERLSVSVFTVRGFAECGVLPVVRFTPTSRMRFRAEDVKPRTPPCLPRCMSGRSQTRCL